MHNNDIQKPFSTVWQDRKQELGGTYYIQLLFIIRAMKKETNEN